MVIIGVALILGILGLLILIPRNRKSASVQKVQSNSQVSKVYSKPEDALHNKRSDCWIIIEEKVYDVTLYVEEHPGGDAILAHAGDDSTQGFFGHALASISMPQPSTRVFDMIEDFCIGELEH